MPRALDLSGRRFGRLMVIGFSRRRSRKRLWKCVCDCGQTSEPETGALMSGLAQSCGCLGREKAGRARSILNTTHGLSSSRVYSIWWDMIRRCKDSRVIGYQRYGKVGIGVCDRWKSFENFYADMGMPKEDETLDRIDGSKGYSPDNCRWADIHTQANNRSNNHRIAINGETLTLAQASRKYGVSYFALRSRRNRGWSPYEAVFGKQGCNKWKLKT